MYNSCPTRRSADLAERLKAQGERAGDEESTIGAYAKKSATLSNPKVAGATGDVLAGYGRYADAIPLYQVAANGGADKPMWTYRLAVAQAMSGAVAGAKSTFGQINGPSQRSEERRVGKEGGSTGRTRGG